MLIVRLLLGIVFIAGSFAAYADGASPVVLIFFPLGIVVLGVDVGRPAAEGEGD